MMFFDDSEEEKELDGAVEEELEDVTDEAEM